MTEEREALKGKLLLLWLEDLKNEREPGLYPEMKTLAASEIKEIMSLARFIKGTFYPSATLRGDISDHAKALATHVLEERARQVELNRAAIKSSANFGELVRRTVDLLRIDRAALQDALSLPKSALYELEAGEMPPHRLPIEAMIALLGALRLASRDVATLIRKSSIEWLNAAYGSSSIRLGRLEFSLTDEEKRLLMEDRPDLAKEIERIESYCSMLSMLLT